MIFPFKSEEEQIKCTTAIWHGLYTMRRDIWLCIVNDAVHFLWLSCYVWNLKWSFYNSFQWFTVSVSLFLLSVISWFDTLLGSGSQSFFHLRIEYRKNSLTKLLDLISGQFAAIFFIFIQPFVGVSSLINETVSLRFILLARQ